MRCHTVTNPTNVQKSARTTFTIFIKHLWQNSFIEFRRKDCNRWRTTWFQQSRMTLIAIFFQIGTDFLRSGIWCHWIQHFKQTKALLEAFVTGQTLLKKQNPHQEGISSILKITPQTKKSTRIKECRYYSLFLLEKKNMNGNHFFRRDLSCLCCFFGVLWFALGECLKILSRNVRIVGVEIPCSSNSMRCSVWLFRTMCEGVSFVIWCSLLEEGSKTDSRRRKDYLTHRHSRDALRKKGWGYHVDRSFRVNVFWTRFWLRETIKGRASRSSGIVYGPWSNHFI